MNEAPPTASAPRVAPLVTRGGVAEAFANVAMPLMYGWFSYIHLRAFLQQHRASLLIVVAFEALFGILFLFRRRAAETSFAPWDFAAAIGGTFLPLLLRPSGAADDVVAGEILQVAAGLFAFWSVASLSRSVGILPANRGIRTGGPYRWVRHPLYGAYTVGNLGYLLSNLTPANVAIVVAALSLQVCRAINEERLLSRDACYREYSTRTRWRLVPYVF